MSKKLLIALSFLCTTAFCFSSVQMPPSEQMIYSNCELLIKETKDLQEIAPVLEDLILNLLRKRKISCIDDDSNIRPLFVNTQAVVEQFLADGLRDGRIDSVVGIIHTPTPATPLCTKGELSETLVSPEIEKDQKRLYTVRSRASIVRMLLDAKAKIYVAYPEDGKEKRTKEQLDIYHEALNTYRGNLFDSTLSCQHLPTHLVGASYIFQIGQEIYVFSIQAQQANAPANEREWALWLGPLDDKEIYPRILDVLDFVKINQALPQKGN